MVFLLKGEGNHLKSTCAVRDHPRKGSVEFWDMYSNWYELWLSHNSYHQLILEELKRETRDGGSVLDIGGGSGTLALALSGNSHRITVIEPSGEMVKNLQKRIQKQGRKNINYIQRIWEDVDHTKLGIFDYVVICNSIYWTRDLGSFICRACEVCADKLFIVVDVTGKSKEFNSLHLRFTGKKFNTESKFEEIIDCLSAQQITNKVKILSVPNNYYYHSIDEAGKHWIDLFDIKHISFKEVCSELERHLLWEGDHFVFPENSSAALITCYLNRR